jgi:hypothetical protein
MDIQHDVRQGKFFTIIHSEEYSLEYNEVDNHLWEFHCPLMPPGNPNAKKIMNSLIEYGLFYIKRNNIRLLENGSCEQVRDFLKEKRELEYLVKHED